MEMLAFTDKHITALIYVAFSIGLNYYDFKDYDDRLGQNEILEMLKDPTNQVLGVPMNSQTVIKHIFLAFHELGKLKSCFNGN